MPENRNGWLYIFLNFPGGGTEMYSLRECTSCIIMGCGGCRLHPKVKVFRYSCHPQGGAATPLWSPVQSFCGIADDYVCHLWEEYEATRSEVGWNLLNWSGPKEVVLFAFKAMQCHRRPGASWLHDHISPEPLNMWNSKLLQECTTLCGTHPRDASAMGTYSEVSAIEFKGNCFQRWTCKLTPMWVYRSVVLIAETRQQTHNAVLICY